MTETWRRMGQAIDALHLLRQSLEVQGKRELADMASDLIRGLEQMVELLRVVGLH